MCTLGLILGRDARHPLIVAANRDESRHRASRAPFRWDTDPPFVAGRDEVAGGTWMGFNAHGVLVGLTNRWTGAPPDPDKASRGALVTTLLAATGVDDARDRLTAHDPAGTNPYILVCADTTGRAWWTSNADPGHLRTEDLRPGAHAIGNTLPSTGPSAKLDRTAAAFAGVDPGLGDVDRLAALRRVLATHTGDRGPRESVCVHTATEYGTVSATVLWAGPDPEQDRLFHAAGPPCTTEFEDFSPRLVGLRI